MGLWGFVWWVGRCVRREHNDRADSLVNQTLDAARL
jgi:hypothetical protein